MHAVSPVHVYVENHVKKPAVATNIDETIKSLHKDKPKGKKSENHYSKPVKDQSK